MLLFFVTCPTENSDQEGYTLRIQMVEVEHKRIKKKYKKLFRESVDASIGNVPKSCYSLLLLRLPSNVLETSITEHRTQAQRNTGGRKAGCSAGTSGRGKEKAAQSASRDLEKAAGLSFAKHACLPKCWCFFACWKVIISMSPTCNPFRKSTERSFIY